MMAKKLVFSAVLLCSFALHAQVPQRCADGTAASYIQVHSCYQDNDFNASNGRVYYQFPSNWFQSYGSIPVTASQLNIRMDPNGPFTLLFWSDQMRAGVDTNGETIKVVLTFQVHGANIVNPWQHGCVDEDGINVIHNVTGDGLIDFIQQIVDQGQAESKCFSDTPHDPKDLETYTDSGDFLTTTITMALDANGGSAKLMSFGAHYAF